MKQAFSKTRTRMSRFSLRNRHFFLFDLIGLLWMPLLALILRLDVHLEPEDTNALIIYTLGALVARLVIFYFFGLYKRYWRYASIEEMQQIVLAVAVATTFISGVYWIAFIPIFADRLAVLPRSIPVIDGLLTLVYIGGIRFSLRAYHRWQRRRHPQSDQRRVAIMGAGDAGEMIVRELQNNPQLDMVAVALLDDNPNKHGMRIHGVPVLGGRHVIDTIAKSHQVGQLIIAMPTAPGKDIREILKICERAGVRTKSIPGIYELIDGTVSVNQLRSVAIEDLLRREPVQTDIEAVRAQLKGRRVLVTGGGGSIGSELCRQILRAQPAELILLGHGENSIFEIYHELLRLHPSQKTKLSPVIADVRFAERIQTVFAQYRPEIIFHAAAHKHVPLMELNPAEAITNNVVGTRNLLAAAEAVDVQAFVMISTDKAVNPTNIMGASKRVAELLVHQSAERTGRPYMAVRFGNVLGSRGSVVLTFKQQIAGGGPVTVTHPDMKRYFMTIPEAVQLVLQAGVLGQGGEVFLLDMGEPVKIVDLARDLIELSGLEVGRDIDIVFTNPRPGDKLFEELFVSGEQYARTRHDKIFVAENASHLVPKDLDGLLNDLFLAAQSNERARILQQFQMLVPEFKPASEEAAPSPPKSADAAPIVSDMPPRPASAFQ